MDVLLVLHLIVNVMDVLLALHSLPTEQVLKSLSESKSKADGRLQRCMSMLKSQREATAFDLEQEESTEQIYVGDTIACYVELKANQKKKQTQEGGALTREFVMVVCEVVQGYGPSGRCASVPAERESADDSDEDKNADEYSIDARILLLSKGQGVLEWVAGGNGYGQDIKGIPVESVVLVRACSASADGPGRAKYAFSMKELKQAASR